ncbi:aquaporin AQPAe.a-like [Convolutriloba macropyga]|uniref:aquaporin AQPAe.a-like n=1 Tax=Convolutriloba macropyga TaxID=536237 RepID=UPI003F520813
MGYYRQHAVDGLLQFAHTCEDLRLWRAVFAELFGTFIMVFVGLSNIVGSEYDTGVGKQIDNLVTPGLTFAAIIMTLIHIIGPTSGCHINPAVTISMMVVRRCHFVKGILYIAVQLIGAVGGAALVYWVAPEDWVRETHLGMNRLRPELNMGQGVVVEMIGTMILVLLVLVISDPDPKKDFEGFPATSAGFMVLACVFFMAPYTGCSLNPARSFGPALVMMDFADYHWIYWVGPILGGFLAIGIYYGALVHGVHKFGDAPSVKVSEKEEEEDIKMSDKSQKEETDLNEVKGDHKA